MPNKIGKWDLLVSSVLYVAFKKGKMEGDQLCTHLDAFRSGEQTEQKKTEFRRIPTCLNEKYLKTIQT